MSRCATRVHVSSPARARAVATRRSSRITPGAALPRPARRGQVGQAGGQPASRAPWQVVTNAGSMTARGPDLLADLNTLPMVWPRQRPGARSITDTPNEVGWSAQG
jgi:hypothetical protein